MPKTRYIYIYNYMRRESCHHSDVVIAYQSVNKSYIYILNVFLLFHCFLSITVWAQFQCGYMHVSKWYLRKDGWIQQMFRLFILHDLLLWEWDFRNARPVLNFTRSRWSSEATTTFDLREGLSTSCHSVYGLILPSYVVITTDVNASHANQQVQ